MATLGVLDSVRQHNVDDVAEAIEVTVADRVFGHLDGDGDALAHGRLQRRGGRGNDVVHLKAARIESCQQRLIAAGVHLAERGTQGGVATKTRQLHQRGW